MNHMSAKWRGLFAVCFVAVFALTGCDDPTEGLQETKIEEIQTVSVVEGKEYTIDTKESILDFTGTKEPGMSHSGSWSEYSGTIIVPDGDFTKASISLEIDIASMFTDAKALTETMLSDKMFDAEKFPKATFQSTGIVKKDDIYAVSGNLKIKDKEKNITFDAEVTLTDSNITSESEFVLNRKDFNINYDGLAGAFIREEVVMLFYIEANAE